MLFIRSNKLNSIILAILVTILLTGCHKSKKERYHISKEDPIYYHQMQHGFDLEHVKKYSEAIVYYKLALSNVQDVALDTRFKAKIAAHNRMGACYRKMCDTENALKQFEISKQLGDTKYAPKAVQKLKILAHSGGCK